MSEDIREAFASVKAPAELKEDTVKSLRDRKPVREKRPVRAFIRTAAVCAAAVFFFWLGVSFGHETAYVSLDINPSLSLSINGFGRVIEAKAYSAVSQDILQSVHVTNRKYTDAVETLLDAQQMQPYLEDNTDLWIAVQAETADMEQEIESSVGELAAAALQAHHPHMQVQMTAVSEQMRTSAQAAGFSAGRYAALCELQAAQPSADMEDFEEASIRDIHEAAHHEQTAAADAAPAVPAPAKPQPSAIPAETASQGDHHGAGHHEEHG